MKFSTRALGIWIPVLGTVICFVLLSTLLQSFSRADDRSSTTVYKPMTSPEISDTNLVDCLRTLPLRFKIGQADWNNGALLIDLRITENPLRIEDVKKDLAAVLSFSFHEMDNVNRLFLRFEAIDPWSQSHYLILASNVKKEEWDPTLLDELNQSKNFEPFPERLVEGLHLTLTNLWKKQFIRSSAG